MSQKGAVLLLTVLIISAVSAAIVATMVVIGIDSTTLGAEYSYSERAQAAADGCAEQALIEIYSTNSFTGTGNATIDGVSCSYEVIDSGGTTRTIQASADYNGAVRRVLITLDQITPQLNITSWQTVSSF